MRWPSLFHQKNPFVSTYNRLNRALLKHTRSNAFPRWSQWKYIGNFLNKIEKRLLVAGFCLMSAGLVLLIGIFLSHHITFVPASGGDYSEALIGEPKYVNPLFASASSVDSDLTSLVYAGLFHYGKDGQLEPYLAQNYTVSDDGKTYTVSLRPDVTWSDGKPFTADDVLFTFSLIQNPAVGTPLATTFQGIKVAKIDDYTVRFTLSQPFAPFLNSLTVGILPEHVWGDVTPTTIQLASANLEPIGAGPWEFSKLIKDAGGHVSSYTLARNNNFFGQKPYLSTMTFKFFNAYDAAVEALRSHLVDAVSFIPQNLTDKLQSKNIATYSVHLPQYTALFFNQTYPQLKDENVRTALAEAIDKNQIVADVLNYNGDAIVSPFLPGSVGYNPNLKPIPPDPNSANQLLDKNGWTRLQPEDYFKLRVAELQKQLTVSSTPNSTSTVSASSDNIDVTSTIQGEMDESEQFYRRDKNNNILTVTITTVDTPEYTAAAELIKNMWEKIGVKTNINVVSSRSIVRDVLQTRNYQILLYGEVMGPEGDPFPFWHSSQTAYPGLNLAMFSDPTADKLLEQARTTLDTNQRSELYQKFQSILITQLPAIFLYTPDYTVAINTTVKGVSLAELPTPAARFAGSASWYVKTKLQWK